MNHISDYQHEPNSIGAHNKLVQLDPTFVGDPTQLNAFQLNVPQYQFFNGAGNPSDVIDISSSYSPTGLAPFNATQQITSNTAVAESNEISQTMTFVSQGTLRYVTYTFCIKIPINTCNKSHFSDASKISCAVIKRYILAIKATHV